MGDVLDQGIYWTKRAFHYGRSSPQYYYLMVPANHDHSFYHHDMHEEKVLGTKKGSSIATFVDLRIEVDYSCGIQVLIQDNYKK